MLYEYDRLTLDRGSDGGRKIAPQTLKAMIAAIMIKVGCNQVESEDVAEHLVESNLVGHDSHGVIRVADYVEWIRSGAYVPNRTPRVILQNESVLILDADFGLGQPAAKCGVEAGITKAADRGISLVGIRNAGHFGRVGAWAELAASRGQASIHFVNGPAGLAVVPFGGTDRRLATTPICFGMPIEGDEALIYDASTSIVSVGTIQVAHSRGIALPEGWIIDRSGRSSTNPSDFFFGGALLPMGGHKGFGLAVLADLMVGVITGGGASSDTKVKQANMLSIFIDLAKVADPGFWRSEAARFVEFVRASSPADPLRPVRLPGDSARSKRAVRIADGIPIDSGTWEVLAAVAKSVGLRSGGLERDGSG